MVEISKSGSGEGLGGVIPRGYSKRSAEGAVWPALTLFIDTNILLDFSEIDE